MKHDDLEYFKDLLTKWLDDLLSRADNKAIGLEDADDHLADPLD